MSPLEIHIALTYHCTANDYRDGDFSAPAVRQSIDWFVDIGFLVLNDHKYNGRDTIYIGTEMLDIYVKKLCSIGLPKRVWTYDED